MLALALLLALLQTPDFICPMDRDVRSKTAGKCPRCGMKLIPAIAEQIEYPMALKITPPQIPAGKKLRLEFQVKDPKNGAPLKQFQVVHEKFFHLFIVSQDLEHFAHVHPEPGTDGIFRLDAELPKPGVYRLLADFYPEGGTPQLIPKTIVTQGFHQPLEKSFAHPRPDLSPKKTENLEVELTTEPAQPIAGKKTLLFFKLRPADGLEPYLGAWGHLLAASNDLIDTIHAHPSIADGGSQAQFDVFFPREAIYRIWVQFQRRGVVNTASFTIPVSALK